MRDTFIIQLFHEFYFYKYFVNSSIYTIVNYIQISFFDTNDNKLLSRSVTGYLVLFWKLLQIWCMQNFNLRKKKWHGMNNSFNNSLDVQRVLTVTELHRKYTALTLHTYLLGIKHV